MITILWLIRSFQGILWKGDTNIWQDEWFIGVMFTLICFGIDMMLLLFISGLIK